MIRTFYFVWNSVTLPYRVKPESSKREQESLRKRKEGRRTSLARRQKQKTRHVEVCGFRLENWQKCECCFWWVLQGSNL
jgi:hypothetical protein